MEDKSQFSSWLRDVMSQWGLAARDVAAMTRVTEKSVYEWLRGKGPMRPAEVQRQIVDLLQQRGAHGGTLGLRKLTTPGDRDSRASEARLGRGSHSPRGGSLDSELMVEVDETMSALRRHLAELDHPPRTLARFWNLIEDDSEDRNRATSTMQPADNDSLRQLAQYVGLAQRRVRAARELPSTFERCRRVMTRIQETEPDSTTKEHREQVLAKAKHELIEAANELMAKLIKRRVF